MTAPWRTLPFTVDSAAAQLAATETLWRRVAAGDSPPALRWYSYTGPAAVLGVSQDLAIVDAAAAAGGVEVAKRTSGGTLVLAGPHLLALDVALPAGHRLAGQDIVEAYRWLGEAFAQVFGQVAPATAGQIALVEVAAARADQQALREASAKATGGPAVQRGLACFGTLSPYEVAWRDPQGWLRKLVGLSQVRKRGVVLYQAGLYTRFSGTDLAGVLALPPAERVALAATLDARVADLEDLDLPPEATTEVMAAFNHLAQLL